MSTTLLRRAGIDLRAVLALTAARGRAFPGLERDLAAIRDRGFAQCSGPDCGVAFPIRTQNQAFASIVIESSGVAAAAPKAGEIPQGAEIARAIEAIVRANPALAYQPFDHLHPDEIGLPS